MLKNTIATHFRSLPKLALALSLLFASLIPAQIALAAFEAPKAPENGYVLDQTGTLTTEEIENLNQQLDTYRKVGKAELGVFMTSKLDGTYLEEASLSTARSWGIGNAKRKNGVLLFIAKDDRKVRIEVGKGLEGELTDAYSGRIVRERITPHFKKSEYYQGIRSALEGIAGLLKLAEGIDTSDLTDENDGSTILVIIVLAIIAIVVIVKVRQNKKINSIPVSPQAIATGGAVGAATSATKDTSKPSSSSSSSSGSSRGFSGGGSFGGGGASGSW